MDIYILIGESPKFELGINLNYLKNTNTTIPSESGKQNNETTTTNKNPTQLLTS